jgi:holo-[acyl-carrier protein] synthase
MSFSLGTDIERITRFRRIDPTRDTRFFRRVFTEREIAYCLARPDPAKHFAARFCAKEAILKALGDCAVDGVGHDEIEITRSHAGAPRAVLRGRTRRFSARVSMSHAGEYAIAVALLTRDAAVYE